nr:hypothetical protein [Tanacetum cinerariifolium]
MTSKAQQIELDNALVAPKNHRVIVKCNMRINPGMKQKEPTYQVVLDALTLTTCYPAFLVTTKVPIIYMHQFWATITKHKSSYRFKINNKKFSMKDKVFKDILNICLRIQGQEFDEAPPEEEALSFIHKNFHSKRNQEDLAYQIDNIDSKKQEKMFYIKFMKINIHHFLEKYNSISMRNRTFMPTAHYDSLLGVPDEQHRKTSGTDEGTGTKLGVLDVPKYHSESEKESWGDSGDDDDDDKNDSEDENDMMTSSLYTILVMATPDVTSIFTTTIPPPPPFFIPLPQEATPTTSEATTSFPSLLDFLSLFKFNDRRKMSQNLEATVLARSSSQPKSTYEAAALLSEFELTKILIDKMEKNKSYDKVDYKRELYNALVKSYQAEKDLFDTCGEVFTLKRSRDKRDKDQDPSVGLYQGT